jgi:hypothetical protein
MTTYQGKRLSPLKAIRSFCRWCCGGSAPEVPLCPSTGCAFHPYRKGTIPPGASRQLMRVFKARCLECAADHDPASCDAFQTYEIHPPCPCWPYRLGRNPNYCEKAREQRRERGKIMGFKTALEAVSGPRMNPNPLDGEMCGRRVQKRLIE